MQESEIANEQPNETTKVYCISERTQIISALRHRIENEVSKDAANELYTTTHTVSNDAISNISKYVWTVASIRG